MEILRKAFIQYTYARIQSLIRNYSTTFTLPQNISITFKEKDILILQIDFQIIFDEAATNYSPAVCNYVYILLKALII